MSNKVIVSKPGINVLTATDPNDLIFSSDYGTLRYSTTIAFSLNYNDAPASHTQYDRGSSDTISLGYKPVIFGFVDLTSSGTWIPLPYQRTTLVQFSNFWYYYNATNIFTLINQYKSGGGGSTQTALFKYFIFANNTTL